MEHHDKHALDNLYTEWCFLKQADRQTISDFQIANDVPFSSITMKRCGVQFRDLTPHQVSQLEYFIRTYNAGEAKV